jgi:Transposase and inactivated derivatives
MRKGEKLDRIKLSPEEYQQLLSAEKKYKNAKVYRRIQAFKMLHNGHINTEVAEFFSVDINTISDWITIFRKGGIESLLSFDYKGRPKKLNDEQISQLRNEASKGSFETAKDIWQYIKDNFGVEFREDYVPKLAKRIGLSYKKTKPVSGKTLAEEVQISNSKNKWMY